MARCGCLGAAFSRDMHLMIGHLDELSGLAQLRSCGVQVRRSKLRG